MRTLPRLRVNSLFLCLGLVALIGAPRNLPAQTPPAKPAATASTTASGFSIETEMLTYRALESNGEAIACDVASFLYGSPPDFKTAPAGAACNVGAVASSTPNVVILPFDRSVFADFQIWRSDMQTMDEFEQRGASACNAPPLEPHPAAAQPSMPAGISGRGLTASSVTGALGAATPAGAALSAASGVLGLFASDQAASPVGGTIEDQAFMDDVGRELRSLNVAVLMPSVYTPYELTPIDPARSPFVTALDKLLHTQDCLVRAKGADDPDVKDIQKFLDVLSGPAASAKPAAPSPAPAYTASPAPSGAPAKTALPEPTAPSHLSAVLSADGLAQSLGADPATGKIPPNAPQHLLMVKALESGGSVNRSSNIFGTRLSYSGGSVGTFALFSLNGQLECSGDVYDYAGAIRSKDFQKQLRAYTPDPAAQVIFQRGSCKAR